MSGEQGPQGSGRRHHHFSPTADRIRTFAIIGVALLLCGVLIYFVVGLLTPDKPDSRRREVVSAFVPVELPPPPPPPPEPIIKPPEPEEIIVEEETPVDTPDDSQQQEGPEGEAGGISIGGDAQAGGDAFNIGAGQGGGFRGGGPQGTGFGGGFGRRQYGDYLAGLMQSSLRQNRELSAQGKGRRISAQVWVSSDGRITRIDITSGAESFDAEAEAYILRTVRPTRAPPQDLLASLPVILSVDMR